MRLACRTSQIIEQSVGFVIAGPLRAGQQVSMTPLRMLKSPPSRKQGADMAIAPAFYLDLAICGYLDLTAFGTSDWRRTLTVIAGRSRPGWKSAKRSTGRLSRDCGDFLPPPPVILPKGVGRR